MDIILINIPRKYNTKGIRRLALCATHIYIEHRMKSIFTLNYSRSFRLFGTMTQILSTNDAFFIMRLFIQKVERTQRDWLHFRFIFYVHTESM